MQTYDFLDECTDKKSHPSAFHQLSDYSMQNLNVPNNEYTSNLLLK